MNRVYEEIQAVLGPLPGDRTAYPITGIEASLGYTMACVRENFRLNPVFTMPLWRRVGHAGGVQIGKHHIPHDVSPSALHGYKPSTVTSYLNNHLTDEHLHFKLCPPSQPLHLGK